MKTQNIYLALFLICVLGLSFSISNGLSAIFGYWVAGVFLFMILHVYSWRKKVNQPHYCNMNGEEVEKQAMEDELKGMSTKGIFNHDNYDSQFD